jgi:hypothetical protein
MRESELYLCIRVNLAKANSSTDPKITADDWKKYHLLITYYIL